MKTQQLDAIFEYEDVNVKVKYFELKGNKSSEIGFVLYYGFMTFERELTPLEKVNVLEALQKLYHVEFDGQRKGATLWVWNTERCSNVRFNGDQITLTVNRK